MIHVSKPKRLFIGLLRHRTKLESVLSKPLGGCAEKKMVAGEEESLNNLLNTPGGGDVEQGHTQKALPFVYSLRVYLPAYLSPGKCEPAQGLGMQGISPEEINSRARMG